MKISLAAGLVLRRGEKTFEIVRQLDDDTYQLEDCHSRRPITLDRLTILKRIWKKEYQIVLASGVPSGDAKPLPPDVSPIDLGSLKATVRAGMERRKDYIDALQKAHITRGQRKKVEQVIKKVAARLKDARPPSASTVMGWARDYQTPGHNPMSLRSGNACRVRQRQTSPVMDKLVSRLIQKVYLTRDRHTLQHTLDCIKREAKELVQQKQLEAAKATISLATLSRRVQEIDLFRRISARDGVARARMVCRSVMDGAGASYPLQRVEVDHTPLNWVVVCDRRGIPLGRPLLTVMIDAFSGYVLGIYLSFYGPGLSSVSGVIRNAVMPKNDFVRGVKLQHRWLAEGIADELVLDNGMEFHAAAFKLMAWELGSDMMFCRVRTPWLKPHVERFFATLNHLTLARGRIHKRVANVLNLDPRKDAAIKFSDLVKGLIMFVADVHPFEINERKLARPYDLMMEGMAACPPVVYPGDMDALRLTSALSKQLTVGPGGVELHGLPFGGPELFPLSKQLGKRFKTLVKWDPDDMAFIWIRNPVNQTWIQSPCRWADYADGLSWNQHLVIRKFARAELKLSGAYEDLAAARLRLHDHWLDATSPKTTADALLAARYSGVTSARVMAPETSPKAPEQPTRLVADVEVPKPAPREVPTFESFEMV
jgi:putative transposase